jgi:hypothetical protein
LLAAATAGRGESRSPVSALQHGLSGDFREHNFATIVIGAGQQ